MKSPRGRGRASVRGEASCRCCSNTQRRADYLVSLLGQVAHHSWGCGGGGVLTGVSLAGRVWRSSEDGSSHTAQLEDLDMSHATLVRPDLTRFTRLDGLGLLVTGQHLEPERAVLACRVAEADNWCGGEGAARGTIRRRLAHEPFGWRPTTLIVTVRRYRCSGCGHLWRQDTSRAARPRTKPSAAALRWALVALVLPAPHHREDRRSPGRVVEHRQRRRPGRRHKGC